HTSGSVRDLAGDVVGVGIEADCGSSPTGPRPVYEDTPLLRVALGRGASELVAGIDPEDPHLAREEAQLLEGEAERPAFRMALDVGIELGGGEAAAEHVALELRHVDAVGGEAAERLVERRRHV